MESTEAMASVALKLVMFKTFSPRTKKNSIGSALCKINYGLTLSIPGLGVNKDKLTRVGFEPVIFRSCAGAPPTELTGPSLYWWSFLSVRGMVSLGMPVMIWGRATVYFKIVRDHATLKAESHCSDNDNDKDHDAKRTHSICWIAPRRIPTHSFNQ